MAAGDNKDTSRELMLFSTMDIYTNNIQTAGRYKENGFVNYLYLSKQFTSHKDTSHETRVLIHSFVEERATSNIM
jgi:hypothetical protein